jgi:1,4-dihydroxy-2-naphthoate octaprenyltransferase
MDRDVTPIGGLSNPMQPTKQLFYLTVIMDILALALSLLVSTWFAVGILLYIMASRAYSYRGIRLKKYPLVGYLTVILCQGALVFFLSWHGSSMNNELDVPLLPLLASSAIIGGYYPLTQVYQHQEDINDDVRTISYVLGKKGTFIFCGIVFALATLCMFFTFRQSENRKGFWLFLLFMSPVLIYFCTWMWKVWKDESKADFRSSLYMNILASACTGLYFGILIFMKGIE